MTNNSASREGAAAAPIFASCQSKSAAGTANSAAPESHRPRRPTRSITICASISASGIGSRSEAALFCIRAMWSCKPVNPCPAVRKTIRLEAFKTGARVVKNMRRRVHGNRSHWLYCGYLPGAVDESDGHEIHHKKLYRTVPFKF